MYWKNLIWLWEGHNLNDETFHVMQIAALKDPREMSGVS